MKTTTPEIEPIDYAKFDGHTEGPWQIAPDRYEHRITGPGQDCSVRPYPDNPAINVCSLHQSLGPVDERPANASLIAAAPYLLDQLRARDERIKELEACDDAFRKAWKDFTDDLNLTGNPEDEIADDLSPVEVVDFVKTVMDSAYAEQEKIHDDYGDLVEVAELILSRFDLEPKNAIFPCSAIREDLRKAIRMAQALAQ